MKLPDTWAELRARIPELSMEALEVIRCQTAPDRQETRIIATMAAATDGAQSPAQAWSMLSVDLLGVGGRNDSEGLATVRMPRFSALGTGRKQAGDGPAYAAAAHDARLRLWAALKADDGPLPMMALAPVDGQLGVSVSVPGAETRTETIVVPSRWSRSVAARAIESILVGGGSIEDPEDRSVAITGSLEKWCAVLATATTTETK